MGLLLLLLWTLCVVYGLCGLAIITVALCRYLWSLLTAWKSDGLVDSVRFAASRLRRRPKLG
jgi:hypothetical protein